MSKYYYGQPGEEIYSYLEYEDCIDELNFIDDDTEFIIIVEMKVSNKAERFCMEYQEFEPDCGIHQCGSYKARNGINGICTHLTYGLIETGRKWKLYRDEKFIKISGRK